MIRTLKIKIAVVECDDTDTDTQKVRQALSSFLDSYRIPLCYSIEEDIASRPKSNKETEQHDRPYQDSHQQDKMAHY